MTRTLPLPDGSWRGRALCATGGADPEWWFPRQGGADEGKAALHWCERCPVQMPCLASALAEEVYADNAFGIRGGLRARERGEMLRGVQRSTRRGRCNAGQARETGGEAK